MLSKGGSSLDAVEAGVKVTESDPNNSSVGLGDSPIIGAGLFVDNEVGAACATGMGEAVIRVAGSAIVVEFMRNGMSPNDACKEAVNRVVKKHKDLTNLQVGFLALNKFGEAGGYSVFLDLIMEYIHPKKMN